MINEVKTKVAFQEEKGHGKEDIEVRLEKKS